MANLSIDIEEIELMLRDQLPGQYRWNPDTGAIYVIGTDASEHVLRAVGPTLRDTSPGSGDRYQSSENSQ